MSAAEELSPDAEELSPDAFCLTLLRAFSTAGAPVVVALRNLMGS